jgi:peptidoglycan biosynthesis protein MviN/MurJ (putative lipid II flippase)
VAATAVGAGILISRLAGLVRNALFAKYLGQQTDEADAFNAAFRIPNLLVRRLHPDPLGTPRPR